MYILTTTTVGLISIIFVEWLKAYLTRFLAKKFEVEEWRDLISKYVGFINLSTIIFLAIVYTGSQVGYFESVLASFVFTGGLLYSTKSQYELKLASLNATLKAGAYLKQRLVRNGLQLSLFVLLAAYGIQSAVWFLLALGCSYFIASALNQAVFRVSFLGDWALGVVNKKMLTNAFMFGLPVSLSLTTDWIINASDKYLLSIFATIEEVGRYASFSELLLQGLTMLFVIPYLALYPRLVSLQSQDKVGVMKLYGFHGSLMLVGAFSLVLMGYIFPLPLGSLVWGSSFDSADAELVPLLVVAICLFSLKAFLIDPIFHLYERTLLLTGTALTVAITNILLGVWMIPLFGVKGAALSSLIAFGTGFFCSLMGALSLDSKMVITAVGHALPGILTLGSIYIFTAHFDLVGFFIFSICSLAVVLRLLINNMHLLESSKQS